MCRYFCIGFIDFILKRKSLLEYTNLFCTNEYKNNDKIVLKHFQENTSKLKCILMFAISIENLKKTKTSYTFQKTLSLSIVYSKCGHEYKKIFKKRESIEILKILFLINIIEEYQKIHNHV